MTHDSSNPDVDTDVPLLETHPTLRPTIVAGGLTLITGLGIIGYLYQNPRLFGEPELAEVIANVVLLGTVLFVGRYLVRAYVLTRTRYIITPTSVRGEYHLLYRSWSRELPLTMIRSHEFRRSRLEAVLGFGSVSFLTGGVTQGLGVLTFEHVANPEEIRALIRELLEEHPIEHHTGTGGADVEVVSPRTHSQ